MERRRYVPSVLLVFAPVCSLTLTLEVMVRFILGLALAGSVQPAARGAAPALMPLPVKIDARRGALPIDGHFNIGANGCADARVSAAAGRFVERISRQTGIPMLGGSDVKLTLTCRTGG